ncbi:aldehyde ferredoxin oxidoreductase family protein [Natronincola ferrireducens]|uniref:Aldehyde:ferredoxin oxidoreductase n=1 Tax=Natronincola ferrireducens TaxID=393762 RepID=A0A1G8ZFV8_9FIRM|nr:aldehyde ferredoxin oxidoreductase family protein [Natronincola ferrireducens]SDK13992.1 aldehyde:ferredoxin oxidoreductase [Natronincola ferrireducens]
MIFPNAKILDVDLTSKEISMREIPGETYRLYPGGSALGLYLILQEMEAGIDPLSPENMLVFSVSALTGLPVSGQSRVNVTTKSPLTGGIGATEAGGFFPAHLKGNGYDAVILRGKSEKPVYLYVDEDNVEIRDAQKMWGKVTGEAERLIKEDLGEERVEIAQIGPGGENLVKYACIMNMSNRANGRNGTGAVMGSKNLKALVVKKARPRKPHNPEGFKTLTGNLKERFAENPGIVGLGEHGTDGELLGTNMDGFLATKNFSTGYFEKENAKKITGTTMTKTILKERDTCYACAIRCKRVVEVEGKVDPLYGGPEYETCATFGSYCGVSSLEDVALANQLCNMYGLDTISCGATIAFAMECYEKGLLTKEDTDGLDLKFGNHEVFPTLIEKIAKREGFGDLLAEGSARAARKIGEAAIPLSISVKNQELPAHMPQYKPAVGLLYAVNSFGADHQSCEHDPFLVMPADSKERKWLGHMAALKEYDNPHVLDDEKVQYAVDGQRFYSLMDTLCLCQFAWGPAWQLYGPADLIDLCKYGIGWETSLYELLRIGERRINMMRYFNAREGFTKKDDYLPDRIFEAMPDGPAKGHVMDKEEFERAKELYYKFVGWDEETGNPTEINLRRLGLGWLLEKDKELAKA